MRTSRIALLAALLLAMGAGAAHAASPNPPTSVAAKAGDQQITVTWKAPTGGTPVTEYWLYAKSVLPGATLPPNDTGQFSGEPAAKVPAGTLKYVLGSDPAWALFNGEPYWIAVRAVDAALTPSVKNPIVAATPFGRPGLPGTFKTTTGDGSITVSNLQPGDANGSPIIDYTVTVTGGPSCTSTAAAATCAISGLATGTYAFQVCSRNAAGTSTACRTRAGVAVTSTADCGKAAGCDSSSATGGGGGGGGASTAPVTATSPSGTSSISVAAARVARTARAVSVTAPVTPTGVSSLRMTVVAKAGSRRLGTCTGSANPSGDATVRVRCQLGSAVRSALRRGVVRLTITVRATPADGSAALSATRPQTVARG